MTCDKNDKEKKVKIKNFTESMKVKPEDEITFQHAILCHICRKKTLDTHKSMIITTSSLVSVILQQLTVHATYTLNIPSKANITEQGVDKSLALKQHFPNPAMLMLVIHKGVYCFMDQFPNIEWQSLPCREDLLKSCKGEEISEHDYKHGSRSEESY